MAAVAVTAEITTRAFATAAAKVGAASTPIARAASRSAAPAAELSNRMS